MSQTQSFLQHYSHNKVTLKKLILMEFLEKVSSMESYDSSPGSPEFPILHNSEPVQCARYLQNLFLHFTISYVGLCPTCSLYPSAHSNGILHAHLSLCPV
jgi:hypothetical protein